MLNENDEVLGEEGLRRIFIIMNKKQGMFNGNDEVLVLDKVEVFVFRCSGC